MQRLSFPQALVSFCALSVAGLLAGCSTSFVPDATPTGQSQIGEIHGMVHGGQSPIQGAEVFLFAAGKTGYGSASTSLIKSTGSNVAGPETVSPFAGDYYVTTDSGGNLSLSGDYTCTPGDQIYMVAYSGDSTGKNGNGNLNTTIMQMAGLGQCPNAGNLAQQVPYVVVNEISTVVFAYSMSGFISTSIPATVAANIGAPATSLGQAAIANAMANALNVVNIAYGQVPTTELKNSNATLPQAKIYSLANLLGECVNTTGPGKGKGNTNGCNTLFTDTNDSTNEAQAIFYIAHNSTSNVSNLFDIISTTPAFGGGLGKAPTDWTLPIIYSGAVSVFGSNGTANTQGPYSIAMDASGNAWIGDRVNGVVEITAQGTVSPSKTNFAKISFGMVKGVTVAPSGSLWIADYGSSKVYVTDTSGNLSQTISSGLDGPAFVAIDTAGDAYVVNEDNSSVSVYNSSATNLAFEVSFSGLNIDTPDLIAIDKNGNAWITSTDTNSIGKLSTSYTASKISGPAGGFLGAGALEGDYWLGFDSSSHMWIGDFANSAIDKGTLSGTSYTFPTTGSTGGGLNGPDLSAIDGAGVIWMPDHPNTASTAASVITAYNGTSSSFPASAGYTTGGTKGAVAAAVDISGDVWVANEDGTVSELLGLGTPTVAPLTPTNGGTKP